MKSPFISALVLLALPGVPVSAALPAALSSFLDQHCIECHDADVKKGGLDLASLPFDLDDASHFKAWHRVFDRVRDGEMPPKKKPQPAKQDSQVFLGALKKPLLAADLADVTANGRVKSRRLTRTEYEHTMHDLLGIDIPLKDQLPEDPASHGFETVSDGQQLSHHQLASYLDVADQALDEAFRRALQGDKPFSRFTTPEQTRQNGRGNYRGPDVRDGKSISWPIGLQFFGRMNATRVPTGGWYRITLKDVEAINPGKDGVVWGTLRSGECESNAPMLYLIGLVEATPEPRDLVFAAWIQETHRLELRPNDGENKIAPTGANGGNVSFKDRDLAKEGYRGIAHRGILMERFHPHADSATVKRNLFGEVPPRQGTPELLAKLVKRFATRAFRRPVTEAQAAPYLKLGQQSLADGDSFAEALRTSYRAILCSPRFLTLIEAPGKLDDHAIASRLSYALWVSMPDQELIQLAAKGSLQDPNVLAAQVERLLADPKAERFITSFTDQWLKLKQIDFTTPDQRQFRSFDTVLQQSMLDETRAYFAEMLRQDLEVTHFIDSDFAFLNGRLARHYFMPAALAQQGGKKESKKPGKKNSKTEAPQASTPLGALVMQSLKPGDGLQKVSLPQGSRRGGLITQGAVLKVTADGTTTSPVVRGVFINERILGEHVPPPPPNVPAIEPDIRGATTIREQLQKHRSNESCASCHQLIDPPGFALENYDPIGGWRVNYGIGGKGMSIDASGITPDGAAFDSLTAWKQIYRARASQMAHGFASQFLTYATGAAPRFSDEAALKQITERVATSGHGIRSILREVMTSAPFVNK
jgi:hypothetical protein